MDHINYIEIIKKNIIKEINFLNKSITMEKDVNFYLSGKLYSMYKALEIIDAQNNKKPDIIKEKNQTIIKKIFFSYIVKNQKVTNKSYYIITFIDKSKIKIKCNLSKIKSIKVLKDGQSNNFINKVNDGIINLDKYFFEFIDDIYNKQNY